MAPRGIQDPGHLGIQDPGFGIREPGCRGSRVSVCRGCSGVRIWWADLVCGSGGEQDGNSAAETIQLFFRVRESLSAGARSAGAVGRGERVRVRRAADGS